MTINANTLEKLSRTQLTSLISACKFFFPLIEAGSDVGRIEPQPFGIAELGAKWETPQDFAEDVLKLTKTKNVSQAYQILLFREKNFSSGVEVKTEEVKAPEAPAATTPDAIQLEKLIEDYESAKTEAEKQKVLSENANIRFKKEFTKLGEIKPGDFKNKVLYAVPEKEIPTVTLSETEKTALEKLQKSIRKNPRVFIENTAAEIQKNVPGAVAADFTKEEIALSSKTVAADLAVRLATQTAATPPSVYFSLAKAGDLLAASTESSEMAGFLKESSFVFGAVGQATDSSFRAFLTPTLGTNIVNHLYGPEGISFRFSAAPAEGAAFEIDLPRLAEGFQGFQNSEAFSLLTDSITDSAKAKFLLQGDQALKNLLSQLPKDSLASRTIAASLNSEGLRLLAGFRMEYAATNTFGAILKTAFPEYLPLLSPFSKWLGLDLGIKATGAISAPVAGEIIEGAGGKFAAGGITKAIGVAAGKVVEKGVSKVAGAVIGKAAGAALGAQIGTAVAPVIGTAVGFVAGLVGGKVLGGALSWIKEKLGGGSLAIGLVSLGLIGAGLLTGIVPLAIAGILGLGLGIIVGLGLPFAAILSQGAGLISGGIVAVASVAVGTITGAAVTVIIALPVVVAIILFIINSGAYIVPPKASLVAGLITSPYIDVIKTVEGENEFENDVFDKDPFIEVSYRIEVRAKKGTLSNVRFDYQCEVAKDGNEPDCPDIDLPDAPKIISPTESFSFTYSQSYDQKFSDSLIIDTITVTADAPDAKGAEAAASASVRIGDPPEECPSAWPLATSTGLTQGANGGDTHKGAEAIDIGAYEGTPIKATHTGIVRAFASDAGPYGKHVEIDSSCDDKVFFSRYAHFSVVGVKTGTKVTLGDEIGLSGDTGNSTGPHLHYEFRYPTGPTSYPKNPPYMNPPFIPKTLPRNCSTDTPPSCGSVPIP